MSTRSLAAAGWLAALMFAVSAAPAAAGEWLRPPFDLAETGASIPVEEPLAAMAPNGDATVVWLQEGSCANGSCTEFQVMARQVRADGSLGPVWRLTPDNTDRDLPNDAEDPNLAVDGAGRALVGWLRPDEDFETRVEVVMLGPRGAPLGAARPISPNGESVEEMGLGINEAGQGVVVWGNDGGIEARRFDAGGPATTATTIHPAVDAHFQDGPVVAVDPSGAATVAWSDLGFAPESVAIEARRLGANDVPGTIHELDSWPQTITEPVAVDVHFATGAATIVWAHFPATGFVPDAVKGAHITAGDALEPFASPVAIDEAANPDVAVAADGQALAVFDMRVQPTSLTKRVAGRRIGADGLPGDLLFISAMNADAIDPQVDMTSDGTAFVGWQEDSPRNVMAARIPAGAGPEAPEPLAEGLPAVETPAVAADRDGSALVAFTRDMSAVRAMYFDGEPPEISGFGFASRGFVGQELLFGANVNEQLSGLSTLAWSFGDGGTGTDPFTSHAFREPGTFPFELRVADTAGNEATRAGSVAIDAPPRVGPPDGGAARRRPRRPPAVALCPSSSRPRSRGSRSAGSRRACGAARSCHAGCPCD